MTLKITSTAFTEGAAIPRVHTCEGDDVSPPLSWGGVPAGAQSLVLIVDDPDAPDPAAPQRVWVHWVLYNLPPDSTGLAQGVARSALPMGTEVGLNDWGRTDFGGPCPPIGTHRYYHKLYALDVRLKGLNSPTKAAVLAAMDGHVIGEAVLMGTYHKAL
jgi:Raf kinase inhibitor-like YbhB/YbcL family protein